MISSHISFIHIKLDSDESSVDSKFAMSVSDFKKMCLEIRGVKSVLGDGIFRIDRSEINNRRFKRSIYISKNVFFSCFIHVILNLSYLSYY